MKRVKRKMWRNQKPARNANTRPPFQFKSAHWRLLQTWGWMEVVYGSFVQPGVKLGRWVRFFFFGKSTEKGLGFVLCGLMLCSMAGWFYYLTCWYHRVLGVTRPGFRVFCFLNGWYCRISIGSWGFDRAFFGCFGMWISTSSLEGHFALKKA